MAYSDSPNMHGLGASGAYGEIPSDIYMRKIEQTNLYEDPEQVNKHMRSLLSDFRPDKPFLAAHETRSGDDRGGGFASRERLSLRHTGSRAGTEAWLPDGTFLEMTERDPRGHALGPDMRKHRDQQFARAPLVKLYDDSDYSVPESGITPTQMVSNIKGGMYQFKDRYQNFSTAFDGWSNGTGNINKVRDRTAKELVTLDGTITDLSDATVANRQDATARLSADPKVAYRHSTPDHRFKVARYGMVKVKQFLTDNNWQNNRLSTFEEQSRLHLIDGQMVNKQLASFILDATGQRETKQAIAQGADYGDSYGAQIRSRKISPDDLVKLNILVSQQGQTQAPTANAQLDGVSVHRSGGRNTHDNRLLANNVQFNHEIAQSMKQATRTLRNMASVENTRERIVQSASDSGVYREVNTRGRIERVNERHSRSSHATQHAEDGRATMNYAHIKPAANHKKMQNTAYENFAAVARNTINRSIQQGPTKNRSTADSENEQSRDAYELNVFDRADRVDRAEHMGRPIQASVDGDIDFGVEFGSTDLV